MERLRRSRATYFLCTREVRFCHPTAESLRYCASRRSRGAEHRGRTFLVPAASLEELPDAARGRVSRSYRQFGAARPPWLNARPPRSESKITHELPRCPFANS